MNVELTPLDALEHLRSGNRRWVRAGNAASLPRAPDDARRLAVVVTCSDLSVAPEAVFGVRAGELLVAQTPGAWIDDGVAATVDFGVRALGVGLVVVLGHEGCGVLDTCPALLPTTAIGRRALKVVTDARERGESAARVAARREARRLELLLDLPRHVVVTGAVLGAEGRVDVVS